MSQAKSQVKDSIEGSVIQCLGLPRLLKGWSIRKEDQFSITKIPLRVNWSTEANRIALYELPGQSYPGLPGADIYRALQGINVHDFFLLAPAHVCDWLEDHPDRVPATFIGLTVPFWGTIFRADVPVTYVRALCVTRVQTGIKAESVMLPTGGHFSMISPACIIRLPRD